MSSIISSVLISSIEINILFFVSGLQYENHMHPDLILAFLHAIIIRWKQDF